MSVEPDRADRPYGMRPSEIGVLCRLVREFGCRRVLEIGMAHGSSTVMLLRTLKDNGGGQVISIDPFQYNTRPGSEEYGVNGAGVKNVHEAGFSEMHRHIDEYDFVAMPHLVEKSEKFDFVFIDGYHSFDFTMVDFFYADLLLNDGGICAFHDTGWPAVNKVVQFVLRNKPYKPLGPIPMVYSPDLPSRVRRRLWTIMTGRTNEMREQRTKWHSLAALQKSHTSISPQFEIARF